MKLLKIILVEFIVFNAVPSFAAEWVKVESKVGTQYFDKSTIEYDNKIGYIFVDRKIDHNNISYNLNYLKVSCKNKTISPIARSEFKYSGETIFNKVISEKEQNKYTIVVKPNSNDEDFLKAVCKYVVDNKVTNKKGH